MPPCGGDVQQGGGPEANHNLKPLILFIKKEKFKMETTRSIRKALSPGEWVTSIDLKDAYFHIPVHPDFLKYLRGQGVSVRCLTVQTVISPEGVLSGHRCPGHPAPQTHHLSLSVLGRLAPQSHVKGHLSGTHRNST